MFTGKTFAFVNYQSLGPAVLAQQTLNNQHVPAISGPVAAGQELCCMAIHEI